MLGGDPAVRAVAVAGVRHLLLGGKARELSLPRAAQAWNSSLSDLRGLLRQDVVAFEAVCISLLAVWRISLRDPRLGSG